MGIRSDSYSSTGEVKAFTAHLLDGQSNFNSTTRPTLTQVEKFIDRASAVLNLALNVSGLKTPITNSTAKLVCDDWTTQRATEYVELTQRGVGYSDAEGSRTAYFSNLTKSAMAFVDEYRLGLIHLGVTESYRMSDGLQFTGQDAPAYRDDPDDTSLAQPRFTRSTFDEPTATRFSSNEEEDE